MFGETRVRELKAETIFNVYQGGDDHEPEDSREPDCNAYAG